MATTHRRIRVDWKKTRSNQSPELHGEVAGLHTVVPNGGRVVGCDELQTRNVVHGRQESGDTLDQHLLVNGVGEPRVRQRTRGKGSINADTPTRGETRREVGGDGEDFATNTFSQN